MHIIPVIDLLNGVVVHAKKGERKHYQPIQSKLTTSSEPVQVVKALLSVYPFTQLYIADLNAIQKCDGATPTNVTHIAQIQHAFPQIEIWLDVGISQPSDFGIWQHLNARFILGSENIRDIATYDAMMKIMHAPILSLDFLAHGYQGPASLLDDEKLWPKDVIVMTLAEVGTSSGPNIARIHDIKRKTEHSNIIAAGGIRDTADLIALKQMGVDHALIATALHQKKLSYDDIDTLMT